MNASSTVDTVTDSAAEFAHRAQEFATDTALPAMNAAATAAAGALKPRFAAAADSARPVLEKAASRAQQTANDTVFPALQSAATTVAESARAHGQDLWERVAETEQAQELARRATLVAAGSQGQTPKRWPLLVAGVGVGVLLGAILGRRTAATPPPAAVSPFTPATTTSTDETTAGDFPA